MLNEFNNFSLDTQEFLEKEYKIEEGNFTYIVSIIYSGSLIFLIGLYPAGLIADFFHSSIPLILLAIFSLFVSSYGINSITKKDEEKVLEQVFEHGKIIESKKNELHNLELEKTRNLTNTKNNAMLEAYRKQLELLYEYKSKGMDIERETFAMRKELLELEKSENKEMIDDLLNTLDRL